MKKWFRCSSLATAMLLTAANALGQQISLKQHRYLPGYSSASAMAWHRGRLYVMGDDAPTLLVLNKQLKTKASIRVFADTARRIPYRVKPDIEAAAIRTGTRKPQLWLFASFSAPNRNKVVTMDLRRPKRLEQSAWSMQVPGLPKPNIEGAEFIKGSLLLANRANASAPGHLLLRYTLNGTTLTEKPAQSYRLELPPAPNVVGLSGMQYLEALDLLLLTVSTELTASTTADGAIGPSYLAFVYHAARQCAGGSTLKADTLVPLDAILGTRQPMKIESVAARMQGRTRMRLYLCADNDDGTTHLFRLSVRLPR